MDELELICLGLLVAAALIVIEERFRQISLRVLLSSGTLALVAVMLWVLHVSVTADTGDFLAADMGAVAGSYLLYLSPHP